MAACGRRIKALVGWGLSAALGTALVLAVPAFVLADQTTAGQGAVEAALSSEDSSGEEAEVGRTELETAYVNMYRLYNPNSGEHFYTSSLDEAVSVVEAGWRWEGVGWVAPAASGTPVYRLYNPNAGDHHYTASVEERDYLVSVGWNDEGIGWYSDDSDNGIAVLRQYNPNAVAGAHNFTTSEQEDASLVAEGWNAEGVAWYASDQPQQTIQARWLVTSAWGSLERYWLGLDASIAKGRLITPEEGAGYYAYATESGAVLRGKKAYGDSLLLADNDGRLAWGEGWLVTGDYDGGELQRYRIDWSPGDGLMGAHLGSFTVDGSLYYASSDTGYVTRNAWLVLDGSFYQADNDGVLTQTSLSGDSTLDGYLIQIYNNHGTDLQTLFYYVSSYPYRSGSEWPSGEWSVSYAKEMYEQGSGNCYRYAALFCWLAKGLGYDASVVAGSTPRRSGGVAAHGWVEIYMDGQAYVCDLSMQNSYPSKNWYMVTYDDAPIYYYK